MVNIPKREREEIKEPIPKKEELEKRELLVERKGIIRKELEKEVAKIKLEPELEQEAKERASQIKPLNEERKLKRLLDLAEEKGVAFAVSVAKGMKDPYTLDMFHDILARDELYKKFLK